MKQLVVQIQPDLIPGVDEEALCRELEEFAVASPYVKSQSITSGEDNGRYINLSFSADRVGSFWNALRAAFFVRDDVMTPLASASIVTCEGRSGWDDYLLLHHFDGREKLDLL